jgi:hypothetical protein
MHINQWVLAVYDLSTNYVVGTRTNRKPSDASKLSQAHQRAACPFVAHTPARLGLPGRAQSCSDRGPPRGGSLPAGVPA